MSAYGKISNYMDKVFTGIEWKKIVPVVIDTYKTLLKNKSIPVWIPDTTGRETARIIASKLPTFNRDVIEKVLQSLFNMVKSGLIDYRELDIVLDQNNKDKLEKFDIKKLTNDFLKNSRNLIVLGGIVAGLYFITPIIRSFTNARKEKA